MAVPEFIRRIFDNDGDGPYLKEDIIPPTAKVDTDSIALAMISLKPSYYYRPTLFTVSKTSITIPTGLQVNIGGNAYILKNDVTLDVSTVGDASSRAGKDVYVYACQPEESTSTEPDFVLSLNSTVPDGYDENNSRKIGGFHCICLAYGTISGYELSGYGTGEILPNSQWDLKFRAKSDNEGMCYHEGLGIWFSIYLASWDGSKLCSEYGAQCADGTSSKNFHGDLFAELAGKQGFRLPWRDEWIVLAKASAIEGTNIQGSADAGDTGGHYNTDGIRFVSECGMEDPFGYMYQWMADCYGIANGHASTTAGYQYGLANASGNYYFDGANWDTTTNGSTRITQSDVDGSNVYGDNYGCICLARSGGMWLGGSHCGSRAVRVIGLSANRNSYDGARLASDTRVVDL